MEKIEENSEAELLAIVRSLKGQVQSEIDLGRTPSYLCMRGEAPVNDSPAVDNSPVENRSSLQKLITLEDVRNELGDCQRCSLGRVRINLVFGEGNSKAELVFVGEAPGGDEDTQGRPFVGRAGQLLTKIIEAMGLKRQDVYICNILKCRPPGNRNPRPEEINACELFLVKQLKAINPRVICALGTFAAHTLLKTDVPISILRGKFHSYQGIKLMPTYHPAFLLRNQGSKKLVWEDIQKIMKVLSPQKSREA
ncbi:MAG: uracil-DNA glycosylase [Deltaproteobacteria bacterium]|nr:uracil-DNA glycosylase [Deltaproteobacteria bacterium]